MIEDTHTQNNTNIIQDSIESCNCVCRLGKIVKYLSRETITKKDIVENGKYKIMNAGRSFFGCSNKYNNEGNVVTLSSRGEYAGYINYIEESFLAGGLCYPIQSIDEDKLNTKFLYYYLKNNEEYIKNNIVVNGSIPALNKSKLDELEVKIPDIETQLKIVKTLDKFTELKNELKNEIDLRKNKQMKYYLNKLLSLDGLDNNDIYIYKLNELIDFIKGVHYDKHDEVDESVKDNYDYYKVLRGNNISLENIINFDNLKLIDKSSRKIKFKNDYYLKEKDILICCAGGSKEHVGKCAYIDKDLEYTYGGFMGVLRNNKKNEFNSKLLYYVMISNYFRKYLDEECNGTTINNLSNSIIYHFKVRFPKSLDEQQKIVDILDKISDYCNNINDGLELELQLREKQYKYYLNKLLTF